MNALILPYPPKELSPNSRVHYMTKHKAAARYRKLAYYRGNGFKAIKNPFCAILPLVRTKHHRDIDNVLAGLKAALDGLTDAGWWSDDHDIKGFQLSPQVYSKKWSENSIIILACEEKHSSDMAVRVKSFRDQVEIGLPSTALAVNFGLTL